MWNTSSLVLAFATIVAAGPLPTPVESARRVVTTAEAINIPFPSTLSDELSGTDDARDLWQLVRDQTLLEVTLNPEMRVKVAAGPAAPRLIEGQTVPFFVRVENQCGATARLNLSATDLASTAKSNPDWLDIHIVDEADHTDRLSGAPVEYKLLVCQATESGRREVRLGLDAGQGTQDIGFRGVTDILFHIRPSAEPSPGD